MAQALDYGYWANDLDLADVAEIYSKHHSGEDFETGFRERFDTDPPEELSADHHLVIVASSLDPPTERIVRYVRERGVPIYVVFFQYFKDGDSEYLARSWDEDPVEEAAKPKATKPKKAQAPWNGQDFYISFGENEGRNWDDAVKYGFVSAGGGKWYSQTLQSLFPGARVFACIPKTGYVGVGTVKETAQPVRDFQVETDAGATPILHAPLKATKMGVDADDDELCEYLVRVEWDKTRKRDDAIWDKGMFANQNSAVRLRDSFTIERLSEYFELDPSDDD